ncbi:MAG TPA: FMN-binding negative transcriptional regulator [Acidimicrobiales bacterium]|nr:FMN-binding negative transcriptional regulator [Acidimicrobiales bacterium]
MYVPAHFAVDDGQLGQLMSDFPVADLVTVTPQGVLATFLPVLYEPTTGERGSIIGHVARSNDQWRGPVLAEALVILHGLNAYVSPSWYPSKAEHGRVVPTWDYLVAHVYGRLVVHDDAEWVEALVRRLTIKHEAGRPRPWSVDDAPATFTAAQLKAIVGVEIVISRVQVKAKWSQNRPRPDIDGVISGLEASGQSDAAAAVREVRP